MGLGFLFFWDKTVINNIFREVKLALKHMAKAPNPTSRRTNNCGGTFQPGDRMYVTAIPATATLKMAENHIKTNSIGLQLQVEWWSWGALRTRVQP